MNKKKRYLVTGGAGFIGSHLTDFLVEQGHEVIVLDNFSTGKEENLNSQAHTIRGDIQSYDFSSLGIFDGIFHLASLARIYPSIVDPVLADAVNIHGSVRIFDYARRTGAKVVFASSSSIYGTQEVLPAREDVNPDIRSPYSLQKLTCEKYLHLFYRLYDLRFAVLRFFNVYGKRQLDRGGYATIIGIFLRQYAAGEPFTIIGDGKRRRDFTYVKDTVIATVNAMNCTSPSLVCNIGTGMSYSIEEVADLVSPDHPREYLPLRAGEYHETRADNARAREILGWQPSVSLPDWLKSARPSILAKQSRYQEVV